MSEQSNLIPLFHKAMLAIYTRAKSECNYNATRFLNMVSESGGLKAAQNLLHANAVSVGFTALWERHRLDLTVEAVVLDPTWKELFTADELAIAKKRLKDWIIQQIKHCYV